MADTSEELVMNVNEVKYRTATAGKSPIGRLYIYRDRVVWIDNASPEQLVVPFTRIRGQRVSPPNKPKVQLQLCLLDDDQATFVFLDSQLTKEKLTELRDTVKEVLQQSLLAHRQRMQQAVVNEKETSKTAELEAKQRLLGENRHLERLYQLLVVTKLVSANDFWKDYYKSTGKLEERVGVTGAFLASIAQSEGTNGVKLNLNPEIIQAIFNTYPVVEQKHLELVPHVLTEQEFWSKFFQSHYFHRERNVVFSPNDPFSECVQRDEEEIQKMITDNTARSRLNFAYLSDNAVKDLSLVASGISADSHAGSSKQHMLVRRCNYLSERIIDTQQRRVMPTGESSTNGGSHETTNGEASKKIDVQDDPAEKLESAELDAMDKHVDSLPLKLKETTLNGTTVTDDVSWVDSQRYRSSVLNWLNSTEEFEDGEGGLDVSDEDAFDVDMDDIEFSDLQENGGNAKPPNTFPEWEALTDADIVDLQTIHDATAELLKHFWTCFPPTTPELEKKIERMEETLRSFEKGPLSEAEKRFGPANVIFCKEMINRAHARFAQFMERRKK